MRENTYVILNSLNEYGEAAGYNFVQGHKYLIIGSLADGKTLCLLLHRKFQMVYKVSIM